MTDKERIKQLLSLADKVVPECEEIMYGGPLATELAKVVRGLEARAEQAEAENAALKAHVERLRGIAEELHQMFYRKVHPGTRCREAGFLYEDSFQEMLKTLKETPAQSLAEHDAEVGATALYEAANTEGEAAPILRARIISMARQAREAGEGK